MYYNKDTYNYIFIKNKTQEAIIIIVPVSKVRIKEHAVINKMIAM